MAEMQDSSVLFSLKGLMDLEDVRIREEAADRQRAAVAAAAEEAARERSRREAEEARVRDEEERRRLEEARGREEEARHVAIREAALMRAKIDAESQAARLRLEQDQAHERALVALREDAQKKRLKRWLITGIAVGVVAIGGGGALYFGKIAPEIAQRERDHAAAIAAQEEDVRHTQERLAESDRVRAQIEEDLRRTKSQKDLASADPKPQPPAERRGRVAEPRVTKPAKPCVDDHDPLNPCIK